MKESNRTRRQFLGEVVGTAIATLIPLRTHAEYKIVESQTYATPREVSDLGLRIDTYVDERGSKLMIAITQEGYNWDAEKRNIVESPVSRRNAMSNIEIKVMHESNVKINDVRQIAYFPGNGLTEVPTIDKRSFFERMFGLGNKFIEKALDQEPVISSLIKGIAEYHARQREEEINVLKERINKDYVVTSIGRNPTITGRETAWVYEISIDAGETKGMVPISALINLAVDSPQLRDKEFASQIQVLVNSVFNNDLAREERRKLMENGEVRDENNYSEPEPAAPAPEAPEAPAPEAPWAGGA